MIVVDLTLPLEPETPVLPGDPPVTLSLVRTHDADGYQVTAVGLGTHSGTHLDAPRHFFPDGATLDDYPAARLVRPGWVIDLRSSGSPAPASETNLLATLSPGPAAQASLDPQPLIGTAMTLAAGNAAAAVPPPMDNETDGAPLPVIGLEQLQRGLRDVDLDPGDFLLLWTGGALLSEEAVPLLLESRAGIVGTDAPSLDAPPYPAHRALLGAGVLLAENLANLDRLGPGQVMCAFLPLAISGADGAPVRAVAWR